MTAGEPAQAVKELDKANIYLAKALKSELLGGAVRQKIMTMKKKLKQIKLHPEKSDAAIQKSYEAITTELSKMIHRMESSDLIQKMERSE